jgi:hypothetical protein
MILFTRKKSLKLLWGRTLKYSLKLGKEFDSLKGKKGVDRKFPILYHFHEMSPMKFPRNFLGSSHPEKRPSI